MEENWILKTPDGHTIYGIKNTTGSAKRAVFIVHGLTGHMYEYQHKRAADHFEEDYDVYRFNLYDGREGGRALVDCTISTHADDLNVVLKKFSGSYDKVFLIGHSYGGTTVMVANPKKVAAVSLWDPSYDLRGIQREFKKSYIEMGDYYQINWGTSYLIGRAMYDEAGSLGVAACKNLSREFEARIQVVLAGDGYYVGKPYSYDSFGIGSKRDIVAGTAHCFYEGKSCDDLLAKTQAWFESF
ncbi:MAG: hypothetical protein DI551_08835 [Micavibrio aeruginosavorus]|uniref:Serine aminopeptidase S33 domain-containing protein n=1 Tax=Micavibrio aeruginosavorus TaxID=349221 RepID=A0A2W5MXT6_9BACT|nr:MAG: hypothetical protein DI551_08835 [Micavibrio aeruginosavorus]